MMLLVFLSLLVGLVLIVLLPAVDASSTTTSPNFSKSEHAVLVLHDRHHSDDDVVQEQQNHVQQQQEQPQKQQQQQQQQQQRQQQRQPRHTILGPILSVLPSSFENRDDRIRGQYEQHHRSFKRRIQFFMIPMIKQRGKGPDKSTSNTKRKERQQHLHQQKEHSLKNQQPRWGSMWRRRQQRNRNKRTERRQTLFSVISWRGGSSNKTDKTTTKMEQTENNNNDDEDDDDDGVLDESSSSSSSDTTTATTSDTTTATTSAVVEEEIKAVFPRKQLLNEKRREFLDHVALITSSFWNKEHPASLRDDDEDVGEEEEEEEGKKSSSTSHHGENDITPQTNLALPGRYFHVVTTAALPWMTGTAVNPLLRAAYLHRRTQQINRQQDNKVNHNQYNDDVVNVSIILKDDEEVLEHEHNDNDKDETSSLAVAVSTQHPTSSATATTQSHQRWVTLVIPWLELEEDQMELYGQAFASTSDQETYIRNWLATEADMPDVADARTGLKLLFYPARNHSGLRSIFAMGDICRLIDEELQQDDENNENKTDNTTTQDDAVVYKPRTDVCILEEPEHCNWYRAPGDGWTQKFNYVVGIVHTNYKEYASAHYSGLWTAPAIALLSSAMVRAYCHQVIKLSDVLQTFAPEKEITSNVHGVRSEFLNVGVRRAEEAKMEATVAALNDNSNEQEHASNNNSTKVYFIGKLLWAKGLDLLLELEDYYKQCTGEYFPIDIYGSGPEQKAIRRAYWGRKLDSKHPNGTAVHHNPTTTEKRTKHRHRHRRHHRRPRSRARVGSNGGNLNKVAFREQLQKIKKSFPSADDFRLPSAEDFRQVKDQLKESMSSVELPTTFHEWRRSPVPATFPGRIDHAVVDTQGNYSIFVNPSVSEVLCTTTAEALAMGKFAIIPVHPSNAFFLKFPNCLAYRNRFEFAANLQWALSHDPEPLTPELAHEFTWEAATDRFLDASAVTWKEAKERERLGLSRRDERIAWFLNELGKGPKGDILRMVLGGGPASGQVKYVLEKQNKLDEEFEDLEAADDDDSEDEGLTKKFHESSFVQALKASMPLNIVGNRENS